MTTGSSRDVVPYSEAQATKWLAWLARGMQQHGQTVFQIEGLQPSWLRTRSQLFVYFLLSRLIGGLAIGFVLSFIVDFNVGFIMGLTCGLTVGNIDMVRFAVGGRNSRSYPHASLGRVAARFIGVGLPVWIIGWSIGRQIGNSFMGLVIGWMFSVVFGVTYGLRTRGQGISNDIRAVETLRWSWRRALKYGAVGLTIGLITGVVVESSYRLLLSVPTLMFPEWWLASAIIVALVGTLCGIIFGGLDSGIIATKTAPNQGIRLSFRNSVFAGVVAGTLVGFVGLITTNSLGNLLVSLTGLRQLQGGISFALVGGMLVALWYGGLDIIQHYSLRLILSIRDCTPLHYARFLDYAAEELNFLQKVGGGYMFIHRYLLEYFAGLEDTGEPDPKDRQPQAVSVE